MSFHQLKRLQNAKNAKKLQIVKKQLFCIRFSWITQKSQNIAPKFFQEYILH